MTMLAQVLKGSFAVAATVIVVALSAPMSATAQATASWTPLAPSGAPPASRNSHSAVIDEANGRMIVFGGSFGNCPGGCLDDVWVLANADGLGAPPAWTQLAPSGPAPSVRTGHSSMYAAATNRMTVFGGDPAAGFTCGTVNDVWVLSNANGLGGTPSWTQLAPSGGPPNVRAYAASVYDQMTNRMILFGGDGQCFGPLLNDVWVLSNADGLGGTPTWTQLTPAGGPPDGRKLHTAVFDPGSNTMTVFGGLTTTSFAADDVWVLSNANGLGGTPTWTQLTPGGTPLPGRNNHTAVVDPTSNRMIVFGGDTATAAGMNDVWVLSNANGAGGTPTWTPLAPSGALPPGRSRHTAVYKSSTNRMVIFAGGSFPQLSNDTWVLTGANGLVSFATFVPTLTMTLGGANNDSFTAGGDFTLGTGSNGIDPVTETVTLQVGLFSATIPPGSFVRTNRGWRFQGVIDGVSLRIAIQALASGGFVLNASGTGANLTGTEVPISLLLIIGDDEGRTNLTDIRAR